MPSTRAVLRDIADHNLDPKVVHRHLKKDGRLPAAVSTHVDESLKSALKKLPEKVDVVNANDVVEQPKIEEPKVEEPKVEEPKVEEPKAEKVIVSVKPEIKPEKPAKKEKPAKEPKADVKAAVEPVPAKVDDAKKA